MCVCNCNPEKITHCSWIFTRPTLIIFKLEKDKVISSPICNRIFLIIQIINITKTTMKW